MLGDIRKGQGVMVLQNKGKQLRREAKYHTRKVQISMENITKR